MTDYFWATYDLRQDFTLRQLVSLAMLELITPSFEGSHSGSQQVFLWSTQTSLYSEDWLTHWLSDHLLPHTGASLLLSTPYPWYSGIWSLCASTCHGTQGYLTTSRNFDCYRRYKSHLIGDQTNQTVTSTYKLPRNYLIKWQHTLPGLYSAPCMIASC